MKAIKLLFLSGILAFTSCSTEADYDGQYVGGVSIWLESSPNDFNFSSTSQGIVKNSQGYFLLTNFPIVTNGQKFSNRGRINSDTTFDVFGNVFDPISGLFSSPIIGKDKIELSAAASNSRLEIYETRTRTDTLGQVQFIEHIDCVLDKQ